MGNSTNSPLRVFLLLPFRVLPLALATGLFLSCPRCSDISASRVRSTSRLVSCLRSPFFSYEILRLFVIRQQAVYQFVAYVHFSSFENFGSFLPLNRLHKIQDTPAADAVSTDSLLTIAATSKGSLRDFTSKVLLDGVKAGGTISI